MAKYIFPGADASCPLGWIVTELERAGFEIHSSETIGVHYSLTINRWYDNWMKPANQKAMIEKYGRIVRIWNIFLAWSTIIARQGNSTCTQLVCHKNLNVYDRLKLFSVKSKWRLFRLDIRNILQGILSWLGLLQNLWIIFGFSWVLICSLWGSFKWS